jgi:hypothetical protein
MDLPIWKQKRAIDVPCAVDVYGTGIEPRPERRSGQSLPNGGFHGPRIGNVPAAVPEGDIARWSYTIVVAG